MRRAFIWVGIVMSSTATASAQDTAPPETKVDISSGGVTISSGFNSLTLGARGQFRWIVENREEADADTTGLGVDGEDGPRSEFDVPRLRLTLNGGVYRPWVQYLFQFDFSRTSGQGDSKIKDAILEIRPPGRSYRITMGQFKVPFSLQQLTSSGRQQFVDRSITDSKFAPAREMGAMFSGAVAAEKVGYAIGVFNGAGESVRQNNRSQMWAGRVFVDPFGAYPLAEGSSDAGDRVLLHVGAAARGGKQIRGGTATGIIEDADNQTAFDVEFAVKAPRFYSTAAYYWMTDEQENPVAGADIDSRGYHAQAGYMLVPRKAEVAMRYAAIDGNTDVDDAKVTELRGVFDYYWQAHNLKVQADIGGIRYDDSFAALSSRARQGLPSLGTRLVAGRDLFDTQFRVQFQVAF